MNQSVRLAFLYQAAQEMMLLGARRSASPEAVRDWLLAEVVYAEAATGTCFVQVKYQLPTAGKEPMWQQWAQALGTVRCAQVWEVKHARISTVS